jgi:hypothetical protein
MKKLLNSGYFYFGIFLLLLIFSFRSLFFDLGKNLISWLDYPYVIWVMYQNIGHLRAFDFINFFNTNAFYPFKNTLLFSDILLPQSVIALPFSIFIKNPIEVFNISFLINFILDYLSLYLFWKYIFKNRITAFLGSVFFIFSPFYYTQLGHVQMLTYWPFFFSLYFLFKDEKNILKSSFLSGLFLAVQFLASVYLSVFLIFTILVWTLVSLFYLTRSRVFIKMFLIFVVFLLFDGVFIKSYINVKKDYGMERNINEYIQYSAHLSDYIFSGSIGSWLHQTSIIEKWNSLDKHVIGEKASSVGFLFGILFILGAFNFNKIKSRNFLSFELNIYSFFSIIVLIGGLIFSLGPRLSFNGTYAHIPLPYLLLLKHIPFFDSIRALARWSFLVYFGALYFVLFFINNLTKFKRYPIFIGLIFVWFMLEYFPISIKANSENYLDNNYNFLFTNCVKNKSVLIEIPYTHLFGVKGGIVDGLRYISGVQLSSLSHDCNLVNGYSGYDLPENIEYFKKLNEDVGQKKCIDFLSLLKNRNVEYIKLNEKLMDDNDVFIYSNCFDILTRSKLVKKENEIIYKIN